MVRFDRRLIQNFDWVLLGIVALIGAMCIANLYSATPDSFRGTPVYLKQLYFFIMGFALVFLIISFDYRVLVEANYTLYGAIIFLLLFSLIFGRDLAGTRRWIDLGFFRLQPSEPAKLMLVITLASYYYRKDTGKGFTLQELLVPIMLAGLPFILIVMQPDLGTALMLAFIFISMTLFVKLRWSTLGTLVGSAVVAAGLGWQYLLKPYQRQRIETFLNPGEDSLGTGYHITQSKIAVGSGSMFGKGYLKGTQGHLDFLPERHTDFAFSVWAEEWGFMGSLFFFAVYFSLVFWGLNIAVSSRDKFGTLLCMGVVSLIFWQAFINLAMVMGLLTVVGMPMPYRLYATIGLVRCTVVAFLVSTPWHGLLEILRPMGMVVVLAEGPAVQEWVTLVDPRGSTIRIGHRCGPGIVMKVIVQLGVGSTQGDTAEFRGKRPVVDVGRAPEIATGGHIAELHHPRGAPQVITLFGAVMIGDVVLVEIRGHAVQEGKRLGNRVEIQQLDHTSRSHRRLGHISDRPGNVHERVHVVVQVGLRQRMVLGGLFVAGLTGVVHDQRQAALGRGYFRHGIAGGHEEVVALAAGFITYLQLTLDDDHFHLRPGETRGAAVATVELDGHGAGAGVTIEAQHLVVHAPGKVGQAQVLEALVPVAKGFYMWTCHGCSPRIFLEYLLPQRLPEGRCYSSSTPYFQTTWSI